MESEAVKYIELGQPDLVAAARWRIKCYQSEVAEYEGLSRFGKLFWGLRNVRNIGVVKRWAAASVERHIEFLQRHPAELRGCLQDIRIYRALGK
jgi:hypothetical protein